MRVLITGVTGLLGSGIAERYIERGFEVHGWVNRTPLPRSLERGVQAVRTTKDLHGHYDRLINLAGASVAGGLWTDKRKRLLRSSRIDFTHQLLAPAQQGNYSIGHLVNGSAIGYYGPTQSPVTETAPCGNDFGAAMVSDWETEALELTDTVEKISLIRTGLVLSHRGGMLGQLKLPAKLGLSTRLGNGQQGQSWVHEADWYGALDWVFDHDLVGPVNLTAPKPVSQQELSQTLARVLNRPCFMRMPGAPLRLLLQDMADLLLEGQWVIPDRLQQSGYSFEFPELEPALKNLLKG
ncbi:MAG: TIGR01777 family oxidoreductase [Saccharospirillum sp.]|nr:TIGR01777 family oxidoreductase [Saccharospirillum sp.]